MKGLLILYSHFHPAFKGGGPIQSLANLVDLLHNEYKINVVCSAYDLGESTMLEVRPNEWNSNIKNVDVFYTTGSGYNAVRSALKNLKPDIIYINGMFSPPYNWLPLILANKSKQKVILSPRGMFQSGALAVRPLKKKVFLAFFKLLGFPKKIHWHATDSQEERDIRNIFGSNSKVTLAANIPKQPIEMGRKVKARGSLRLIFLSLITEKKNLHIVLEALKLIKSPITFHIYGPVKDQRYWKQCEELFKGQNHLIEYFGSVNPSIVQGKLSEYDAFILPTKGENFGHAIYEALSVGTPAIISQHTPWGNLKDLGAGITVESEKPEAWAAAIQEFISANETMHASMSKAAFAIASDYYYKNDFVAQYNKLFS